MAKGLLNLIRDRLLMVNLKLDRNMEKVQQMESLKSSQQPINMVLRMVHMK